ncbi:hypothetical protein DZF91_00590 [Actinomadura logoneensis]|uniref:Uncharacterized protein n=1 Tax=Actinomadura logoneensis TaxID=2293572 RepID=A0A372JU86_9ACTN|nr:hypothetical protein [Actinomadura logoneensis]RFU43530.1 hypothetical protein DZF91_00590 [Actinomadura logoneensis]
MTQPRDDQVPSLQDEIFAVASTVEAPPAERPRLRWERPPRLPARADLWTGAAGALTFALVDLVMMYAPMMMSRRPSTLPQFVALIVVAFGLGSLLVWKVGGRGRPFGFGMMIGWAFLTLVSVGFLTGLTL